MQNYILTASTLTSHQSLMKRAPPSRIDVSGQESDRKVYASHDNIHLMPTREDSSSSKNIQHPHASSAATSVIASKPTGVDKKFLSKGVTRTGEMTWQGRSMTWSTLRARSCERDAHLEPHP